MYINTTGYFVPEQRVLNQYFLPINGLSDEWIYQRTGIKSRSKASESETMDFMCIEAVKDAKKTLTYDIKEVDLIIFASYTPSDLVATTAHVVQRAFGIENAKAFFISSACSSAINATEIIQSFFISGKAKKALLISADRNSSYADESDPKSGHLWGDAAAAVFFSKDKEEKMQAKVLDVDTSGLGCIGKGPGGVYLNPQEKGIKMPDGRDVFIQACSYIAKNTQAILDKNKFTIEDLTYFIGHQANMRILSHVSKELGMSAEKCLSNIEELGNTGSVSSILVFAQNYSRFKPNDLICISTFGGGYSSGACLLLFE
ncbi:3-oxoacyl-[acyl-carrier-protein] synthase III [Bacteroidales bacterium]|nr:3-oxoacyl-[acyl-carrier-protein] synthase III [Bacteroidales bacterium]